MPSGSLSRPRPALPSPASPRRAAPAEPRDARPSLESARLWIRPAQGRLAPTAWDLLQDLPLRDPARPDERIRPSLRDSFVLLLKPSGLAIGVVELQADGHRPGGPSVRFGLDPAFQGQGLVLEACRALIGRPS